LGVRSMARVRRRRVRVVRFAATLIVMGAILLGAASVVQALRAGDEKQPVAVTVVQGDTLWRLAERFGPDHTDTRLVVEAIRTANGLEDGSIYPGQTLIIPWD
jgi:nucleoid-associated protein YgaU